MVFLHESDMILAHGPVPNILSPSPPSSDIGTSNSDNSFSRCSMLELGLERPHQHAALHGCRLAPGGLPLLGCLH